MTEKTPKLGSEAANKLGLEADISRRDMVGGVLIGAGAALLASVAPGAINRALAEGPSRLPPVRGSGTGWRGIEIADDWQGPGGIGDYSKSNGNTGKVIRDAHAGIRNHEFEKRLATASDVNEKYDVIIVGAGISGLHSAYDLLRQRPNIKILMLDNHAIFGGEAKQNKMEVDGQALYGGQGPTLYSFVGDDLPSWKGNPALASIMELKTYPKEFGLPTETTWSDKKTDVKVPVDLWFSMASPSQTDIAYRWEGSGLVKNPLLNSFRDAPVSQKSKDAIALMLAVDNGAKRPVEPVGDVSTWVDNMTYAEFLKKVYGADDEAVQLVDQIDVVGTAGLGGDVFNASLAALGLNQYGGIELWNGGLQGLSLPTGNGGVGRSILRKFMPGAIKGGTSLTDTLFGDVNWDVLDHANNNVRIRLNSTVVGVQNNETPTGTKDATVFFLHDNRLYKAKGKAVIMGTPQQVNRNVCLNLPNHLSEAMGDFHHAPILVVNVALRNWKSMEKAGVSGLRWFGEYPGIGQIVRSMVIDGKEIMPCDPSKPAVMTFYIPMNQATRGMPRGEQAMTARHMLFNLTFADIELLIRDQLTRAFGSYGFDAKRDIAAIVANRWGHALVCAGPGFYTGLNGKPPVSKVITAGWDRVAFGHSDLSGRQAWTVAVNYARTAVANVFPKI
uniref:Morphinan N-demethylase n=1 Tax=Methylobacterium thebainfresser TaxID=2583594 RepID=A0A4P9D6D6_9HYPH|nr:morphinan N-demethylase [Methylobacterium thebainfresser]